METVEKKHQRSGSSIKKTVTFNNDPIVYIADDYDRKSEWMQHAMDSSRFKRHVNNIEHRIGYIFEKHYRDKMFAKLFV